MYKSIAVKMQDFHLGTTDRGLVYPVLVLSPAVVRGFDPQQDPPLTAETLDDTVGYIKAGDGGCVPSKGGQLFQIAPNLAIRLTLPDPAPVARSADVQGFMMNTYQEVGPNENIGNGQSSEGSTWGWVPIVVGFVSDPAGTVFGHFFRSFKS